MHRKDNIVSRYKKKHVGKIAYCDNIDLGIGTSGGHYVYIRKVNDQKCDVNVITSLEDHKGRFNYSKIVHVRKGNTYPIPKRDANFTLWSGVTKTPIKNIPISKLKHIGKKSIKRRHHFYIGKYAK